jgi:cytochrome c biogenesis protein CcmG/thiol:disulfide interchange protein DsbE
VTLGSRRRWVHGALAAVAIASLILLMRSGGAPSVATAPRFVARTIDSVSALRSLDDYAGHPLLLNVWATWCDPCREEMPSLERLYRDYRVRGLRIAAISIDDADKDPLIREFVAEHDLTFDILHDAKSSIMDLYGVRGVPQTFLISRAGEIVATRFVADWSSVSSRALIDSLLRVGSSQQSPAAAKQ